MQLKRKGHVKAIAPLVMSRPCLKMLREMPNHKNTKVNAACIEMLGKLGIAMDEDDKERLTNQTVQQLGEDLSL